MMNLKNRKTKELGRTSKVSEMDRPEDNQEPNFRFDLGMISLMSALPLREKSLMDLKQTDLKRDSSGRYTLSGKSQFSTENNHFREIVASHYVQSFPEDVIKRAATALFDAEEMIIKIFPIPKEIIFKSFLWENLLCGGGNIPAYFICNTQLSPYATHV